MSDVTKDLKCTAFISYSRDDEDWVDLFVKDLRRVTYSVWYDDGIPGGVKWWQEICKQIRENSVFVCLLSLSAVKSINCREELLYAINLKKPIIPIWVHQTEDEKNSPNEKIYHLGDDLWNKFSDTQSTHIVVDDYLSDATEGLLYTMEIGQNICNLVIQIGTGDIEIDLDVTEPGMPRYKTENDFQNALDRAEELFAKEELFRAREICIQIDSDSNGEYKEDTDFLMATIDETRDYDEVVSRIKKGELSVANRRYKRYRKKHGNTKRTEELQKLINDLSHDNDELTKKISTSSSHDLDDDDDD